MDDVLDLIEQVKTHCDSRYRSLLMSARRARQIQRGSKSEVSDPRIFKPTIRAMAELREGMLRLQTDDERSDVPEAPSLPDLPSQGFFQDIPPLPDDAIRDFE